MKYYRLLNEGEQPIKGDEISEHGDWFPLSGYCLREAVLDHEVVRREITHFTDATALVTDPGPDPLCPTCDGYGRTPGWIPTYHNPDNSGGAPESEPCHCTRQAREERPPIDAMVP